MRTAWFLCGLVLLAFLAQGQGQGVGGVGGTPETGAYSKQDPNSADAKLVSTYCLGQLNKKGNTKLRAKTFGRSGAQHLALPLRLVKRQYFATKVVSGAMHQIQLKVKDKKNKYYRLNAIVWRKPWIKWWKLVEIKKA